MIGDKAGEIRPVDDLLWKPGIGWNKDSPPDWPNVVEKYREHAVEQIYRLWRPKLPIKQWGHRIETLDRILPMRDHLVQSLVIEGKLTEKPPAKLFAKFWKGEPDLKPAELWITTKYGKLSEFTRGFSIDTERAVIHTSEPLFRITTPVGKDVDPASPTDIAQTEVRPGIVFVRVGVQGNLTYDELREISLLRRLATSAASNPRMQMTS